MPYVLRGPGNAILALYRRPQPGRVLEQLDESHPDVVAFLAPPSAERRVEADATLDAFLEIYAEDVGRPVAQIRAAVADKLRARPAAAGRP